MYALPTDRATTWNPWRAIPTRTTVYTTINASTYGNGTNDARAGIQSALDNCPAGQVVLLSSGTFKIMGDGLVIDSGITLRGAGAGTTTLTKPSGTSYPVVLIGTRWTGPNASTNLTADATKGNTSVTVTSTTGLSVGQIVLIDALQDTSLSLYSDDCGTDCQGWFGRVGRPLTEMKEISNINGSTVTFTTPFHASYTTAKTAQLSRFPVSAVKNAGIEDLTLYGGEGGDGGGSLRMEYAANCWAKKIESTWSIGASGRMYYCFGCVFRDSYFHETPDPNPGGAGYGIDISIASSDCLVENCISWKFNKCILSRCGGGGNVIGYNYFEDGYGEGYLSLAEVGMNASHMTTPHHFLFEGNQGWNFGADARWGNSIYITFFRNNATTLRRDIDNEGFTDTNRYGAEIKAWHWWYSFVGNVIGYSGANMTPVTVWSFGGGDAVGTSGDSDALVEERVLRDGNYDYKTQTVGWDSTQDTLPNSLYLSSKPSFFGSLTWPWVDGPGTTKLYTLPARDRFDDADYFNILDSTTLPGPANVRWRPA